MSDFHDSLKKGLIAGFVDEKVDCRKEYLPSIILNDKERNLKVLTAIYSELENCQEFWFSVAFVTANGVACIIELLKNLQESNIPGKILVSKYQNFTEPEALRRLLQFKNIRLKISENNNFHAKAYLFRSDVGYNLILGSSNLTSSALCTNTEWNLKLSSSSHGKLIIDTLREFKKEFESATLVNEVFVDEYQKLYDRCKVENGVGRTFKEGYDKIYPNKMQLNALQNLERLRKEGSNKALLISATGTGKTYLSAFDVLKFRPKRFLFIVHRLTIAKEALESFKRILGKGIKMGVISGVSKDYECDYIFSTIQTIAKKENYSKFDPSYFDYIVIDETHRSGAESYIEVLDYFKPKFLLGMTATPERTDGYDIFKQFDYKIAYEIRLQQALEEDMLSPFHYYGVTDVKVNGVEINEESAFNLLTSDERVNKIIENARFYGCDSGVVRGLIFCRSIEECNKLSSEFNKRGLRTLSVNSCNSNVVDPEIAIERLESEDENEKIDYIFTVDMFNEGVDIPRVNQIILLRPTQSAIVFVQQLGRGLRKAKSKSYLTVIDFIGNYSNNFLVPIALFGDNSYDRENLRKLVSSGSRFIPGESTVNFDKIARNRIFDAINNGKWQNQKDFDNDYKLLKYRLGREPFMIDYLQFGSRDPYQFVEKYDSYYNFLSSKVESLRGTLKTKEVKCLEFLSKDVLNGVRFEEILILRTLESRSSLDFVTFKAALRKELGIISSKETWMSSIRNINLMFAKYTVDRKRDFPERLYKLKLLEEQSGIVEWSEQFSVFLANETFREFYKDLLKASEMKYRSSFNLERFNKGFIYYQRYTRKDVFRILNWEENPVALNVGGYQMHGEKKDMALFVTYHKSDDKASSIKYKEEFISNREFKWMSKHPRSLKSKEIVELMNWSGRMRVPLFVKKSDDEESFYYIGDVTPIKGTFEIDKIALENGGEDPVVTVHFMIDRPVEDSIFSYLKG